jgi:hypothetical protein
MWTSIVPIASGRPISIDQTDRVRRRARVPIGPAVHREASIVRLVQREEVDGLVEAAEASGAAADACDSRWPAGLARQKQVATGGMAGSPLRGGHNPVWAPVSPAIGARFRPRPGPAWRMKRQKVNFVPKVPTTMFARSGSVPLSSYQRS